MSAPPRPQDATELFDHRTAEEMFLDRWRRRRLAHSWLITGPEGIGKATFAYRIARFVLADGEGADAESLAIPATHPVFRRVSSGGHADLMPLSRATGAHDPPRRFIGVDDVRAAGHFLSLTPAEGRWRVMIVDSVDDLNANAANALLKMLEEPPNNTLILLVSHSPGRLPQTLRSRCCRLPLSRLSRATMRTLQARFLPGIEGDALRVVDAFSEGSIGRAVALAEADGPALFRELMGFAAALPTLDFAAIHAFAERLARRDSETSWRMSMRLWTWWLSRTARAAVAAPRDLLGAATGPEEDAVARNLIDGIGVERLVALWEKTNALLSEADRLALDRKQVTIGVFHQTQSAFRA